jgi:hypothetical protein
MNINFLKSGGPQEVRAVYNLPPVAFLAVRDFRYMFLKRIPENAKMVLH